jgi:hypothetical protein
MFHWHTQVCKKTFLHALWDSTSVAQFVVWNVPQTIYCTQKNPTLKYLENRIHIKMKYTYSEYVTPISNFL